MVGVDIIKDNSKKLINKINKLKNFDILITTGGISEGKYDIVKNSLDKINVKVIFDKVLIKPGKPTTFGKFDNKILSWFARKSSVLFYVNVELFPIYINKFYGTDIVK